MGVAPPVIRCRRRASLRPRPLLPMYRVMAIFIEYPLLAVLPAIAFLGLYRITRRPFVVVVALAWLLYGIYEYAMHERILCSGECNIRVDLLAIYPALVVASGVALGLAAAGLRGTPKILEGGNGYFRAMADILTEVPEVVMDLGKGHRILEAATKLYPSGIANQAAIFAAREIVREHRITPEQIAAVRIKQFSSVSH